MARAYFQETGLIRQQIDSYNEFVNHKIHEAIREIDRIETSKEGCYVKFYRLRLEPPVVTEADGSRKPIMPFEARIRNRTYAAPIFLEMALVDGGSEIDRDDVYIGDLPVMVKSDLCYLKGLGPEEMIEKGEDPDDPGGYFIINGSEKVLVAVEDLAPNRMIFSIEQRSGRPNVVGRIFSVRGGFRAKVAIERNPDGIMYISFPTSPKNLNLFIVLKALGLERTPQLMDAFSDDRDVINDVLLNLESIDVKTAQEALDYIGRRVAAGQPKEYRIQRAEHTLDNYLLPHIGLKPTDRLAKAYFLARMAERCTYVGLGRRPEDDKDHYANKRIKVAGALMDDLFRYALSYFIKDLKYQIERAYARNRRLQIRTLVRPDALTERIRFAMATGTWVGGRTGISQLLDRITYMAAISHLRRVVSPLSKSQAHFEARDLHPTHFGKICPNETPEGHSCGLVKNLAMGVYISSKETVEGLESIFKTLGTNLLE